MKTCTRKSARKNPPARNDKSLPGTLWKCHGAWHWRVAMPGKKRRDITLTMPFSDARIPESADVGIAESAAWRLWEKSVQTANYTGKAVFTLNDLCDRWSAHAAEYYRRADGSVTPEARTASIALRTMRGMFGSRPVESLTHADMLKVRDALVRAGLTRVTVNKYISMAKRMFGWALDELLISAQTKAELTQVSPLKPHRSAAPESPPVDAATDADIAAACERLTKPMADMITVHRLTGMRPDEMCALSWERIERSEGVWVYRPAQHKNQWRTQPRVVVIGPRAQKILKQYEGCEPFVFSPAQTIAAHYEMQRANRKTPLRGNEEPVPRKCNDRWDVCAYNRAVHRACLAAGIEPWTPNQLRHSCATVVRRRFSLAATSAVLGHTTGQSITDRYSFEAAEDEIIAAATPAMLALG